MGEACQDSDGSSRGDSTQVVRIVERFEEAWERGERPAIDAYLPAGQAQRREVLIQLVHVDLERRLKAREAARVEDYLHRHPELGTDPAVMVGLVVAEYGQRRRHEAGLSAEEYFHRFPALATEVRACLRTVAEGGLSLPAATVHLADTPLPAGAIEDPHPRSGPADALGRRYHLVSLHARGGLGEVWLAEDEELHREVALKRIQDCFGDDPESRQRFLREAEVTGRLQHPGIVPVHGLVCDESGEPCYAMRFIEGQSLKEAIEAFHEADARPGRDPGERSLALRQLLTRFIVVCNAIAYAHSRGILHRDLKPANIMLGRYGETLVVDWGLAKPFARTEAEQAGGGIPLVPSLGGAAGGTREGEVRGTPAYMSPEQAAGWWNAVGPASDVYSLGATLYHLLAGRAPFQGSVREVLQKVQQGDFPPSRQLKKDVPRPLEAVCLKAMALRVEDRYRTAGELAADVERFLADEPVAAYREPW